MNMTMTLLWRNFSGNILQTVILSPFWWPFSRWIRVSRYQNVSFLDFVGAKDDGGGGDNWSYKMCKSPVTSSTPINQHPTFYRRRTFLSPNQQCQSTEEKNSNWSCLLISASKVHQRLKPTDCCQTEPKFQRSICFVHITRRSTMSAWELPEND